MSGHSYHARGSCSPWLSKEGLQRPDLILCLIQNNFERQYSFQKSSHGWLRYFQVCIIIWLFLWPFLHFLSQIPRIMLIPNTYLTSKVFLNISLWRILPVIYTMQSVLWVWNMIMHMKHLVLCWYINVISYVYNIHTYVYISSKEIYTSIIVMTKSRLFPLFS